ncbi:hypothetical protein K437DRAFT_267728 [Tilletiaria anomala UBC 951]|uniref:Uncharacterized protein n=1 Tax=Tilletiaria anomala (strain ATCC 24038 / CBS 436.72 / UBC 951) TaxID=1037660 RepID=A0A066W2M1_TILAU|nr:uncharacterized protein K437DRAFT_267728 [Tilletiaria anomala UBC 951]KDN47956.1 hypothetical protein K437DRAFT_267728 [Tilletiaria anomala UBC 951]
MPPNAASRALTALAAVAASSLLLLVTAQPTQTVVTLPHDALTFFSKRAAGPYSPNPVAFDLVARAEASLLQRQQQDPNTPLYLNSPACDFYQCSVNVTWGDTMVANWLNAPAGDVIIDLMTNASSAVAYNVATVPGTSQKGYCDAGFGIGVDVEGTTCGRFEWIIPSTWAAGNYTLRAMSKDQPDIQSYTDVILIFNNLTRTNRDAAFSTVTISGAPTSTTTVGSNFASTPQPTALLSPGGSLPASTQALSASYTASSAGASNASSSAARSKNSATPALGYGFHTLATGIAAAFVTGFFTLLA